jgi:hypothetical protein
MSTTTINKVHIVDENGQSVSIADQVLKGIDQFYESYLISTVDGTIQIFRSFTYGEMVISFLLLCILFVLTFMWFWGVLR